MKNESVSSLTGALAVAVLFFIVAMTFHFLFAVGNFLIVEQAFLAQNWEQVPVGTLPFVGPVMEALGIGDANVAQVFAAGLVGVINVVFWILVGIAFGLANRATQIRDAKHRLEDRDFLESSESEIKRGIRHSREQLTRNAIWLVILIPIAILMVRWDMAQFVLRWELNQSGHENASYLLGDDSTSQDRLGGSLYAMLTTAALGYIACMLGACVASHYAMDQVAEKWRAFSRGTRERWEAAVADADPGDTRDRNAARVAIRDLSALDNPDDSDPLPRATYAQEVPFAPPLRKDEER